MASEFPDLDQRLDTDATLDFFSSENRFMINDRIILMHMFVAGDMGVLFGTMSLFDSGC